MLILLFEAFQKHLIISRPWVSRTSLSQTQLHLVFLSFMRCDNINVWILTVYIDFVVLLIFDVPVAFGLLLVRCGCLNARMSNHL